MARQTSNGWQDLRSEALLELEKTEFEAFCTAVVKYEAFDRHIDPSVDGGAGESVPDGGRDLLLTVTKAPEKTKQDYQRTHHLKPLTEDPIAGLSRTRTAYSCKSGRNWLTDALDDAREGNRRAVEVLAEGGYFKLCINRPGKLDATYKRDGRELTPEDHLRMVFWDRLRALEPNAGDPGGRIEILDADVISTFLRSRQPESGDVVRWLDRLDLASVLNSLEEWRSVHVEDRGEPIFHPDDARARVRQELVRFVLGEPQGNEDRVACIVGQPGVGKTRLVLESFVSNTATAQRVRVAFSPEGAIDAIDARRRLLRSHKDIVLVVDDCLVDDARTVASRFRAAVQDGSRARLVLLVPASYDAVKDELPSAHIWAVDPLDHEHTRAVVVDVTKRDKDDADVVAMARFSEGFPWFARLLADEFNTEGRAPADMREAVRWALASRREAASPVDLGQLRLRRARSLLVATLTRAADWSELLADTQDRLARAVGLPHWQEVMDAALECERRGILRRALGWHFKYVTPQILEREIIAWLLGPDGPDPGGRTLATVAQDYLENLFVALARVGLPPSVVAGVVDVALQDLTSADLDLSQLAVAGLLGARLRFLAHHRPAETARELRGRIDRTSLDELRAKVDERRGLVWALDALSRTKQAFEDAEAALFRLARAENEPWGNNATAVWTGLFFVDLNVTLRPLSSRLRLLEARLLDLDADARTLALKGVEAVITTHPWRVSSVRGESLQSRLITVSDDARSGRLHAWSLLGERFADSDPAVARAAKMLAVKLLRGAILFGFGEPVMDMLEARVSQFSPSELVFLREKIEEIHTYDSTYLDPSGKQPARLEAAIAPRSFRERLRQRVGVWGPAALRSEDSHLDDALAQEGLAADVPLRFELEWLVTEEAQRSHVFAYAIGCRDIDGVLSDDLRRIARDDLGSWKAHALLARYIGGMAKSGRREQAEALLRVMKLEPEECTQAALAIVELGATPEDLEWLVDVLGKGKIAPFAISELARRRSWLSEIDDGSFNRFVSAVAGGSAAECASAALELLVERYGRTSVQGEAVALLESILERLAPTRMDGMTEHYWELGAKLLIRAGEAARVAALAVTALARVGGSNDFAWSSLHAAAAANPSAAFWAVVRRLDASEAGGRLLIAFCFHRQPFEWPTADVLAWVGDDEERALDAAAIVRPGGEALPDTLRALIRKFGPHGVVAREIMGRIQSTEGIVPSLADHDRKQLERARHWLSDPDPAIAEFARELVDQLERSYERHAAYEEHERRRFGT